MPLLFSKKGSINLRTFIRYGSLNFRLGSRCGPLSKHPLPPPRHLPHLTIASVRPTFPGINPDQEMRQCIINKSYRAALITSENPELREVDLEPNSKRGCSKCSVNKLCVDKNICSAMLSSHVPLTDENILEFTRFWSRISICAGINEMS